MLIIQGHIDIDPASVPEIEGARQTMMAETMKEDGCLHYSIAVEDAARGRIGLSERWRDGDCLARHGKAAHMADFQKAISGKVRGMDVKMYDAANERPLGG
ncbi:MAG: antibiotic biosynthesis monooxygenase [Pacificimonas sp.]